MKNIEGLLIRMNREKRDLTQEYLCKGVCSVSYLSKIEKGDISASDEIINLLFKRLEIKYYNDIDFVKKGKAILSDIEKANYFGLRLDEKLVKDTRKDKDIYLNSPLFIDYHLFELYDKCYEIKNIDILKHKEYMNNNQLYKAYFLTGFVNNDIDMLENAKRIINKAEVVRQIGYVKWIEGKYYESIEFYLEALSLANNEGNIKEQINICIMLGNIYMDIDIHSMEKHYNKALLLSDFSRNNKFKYSIYYHMGVAYTTINFDKSEHFLLKALKFAYKDDHSSLEKLYQKLCFLYLNYGKKSETKEFYKKAKEINISKEVNELIQIMIDNENYIKSDLYLNKLEDIYNSSKNSYRHSNTKYYGNFLIESYKETRRYKLALEISDYLYRK